MIREDLSRFAEHVLWVGPRGACTQGQAAHLAARLYQAWARDQGLLPHEPIGLSVQTRPADLVALLAGLLHPGDLFLLHPRAPKPERARLRDQVGFRELEVPDRVEPGSGAPPPGPVASTARGERRPKGDRKRVALFTSGSTGAPKAVCLDERSLRAAARASAANLGWCSHDRWLLSIPLAHVGGLSILTRCLFAGRTVVLPDALQDGFRPEAFHRDATRFGVTLASLVPTMVRRLLDHEGAWPAGVRAALVGGAPTPDRLLREASGRGFPLLTTYGMTEAASQVSTQPHGTPPDPAWGVGRPLAGIQVRIGAEGQIWIRGPNLFQGYWNESARARDAWFDTGDLGSVEDGRLFVRGRAKTVIVSGGENVDPAEVEAALLEHPAVEAAVVVGLPDPEWGERVEALVAPRPVPDIQTFLRERLSAFKVPKTVHPVPSVPTTPLGKPDRPAALRWLGDRNEAVGAERA